MGCGKGIIHKFSNRLNYYENIDLGGDQPKWDVGRVNFVTFAGTLKNTKFSYYDI